ncbi:MAG: hypothetical protein AB8G26_18655 [Ilumatobacter sp.]
MRSAQHVDPARAWRTAVDLLVFAPIGLGTVLIEDGPDVLKRTRQELTNARFIGELTVNQGVKELRRRIDEAVDASSTQQQRSAMPVIDVDVVTAPPAEQPIAGGAVCVDDLALPDYDTLPAIDIVDKLEHLSATERDAIASYEAAHRKRRTVLGKLAQLEASVGS